ncbi:hypothetical protein DENSPDRAFT_927031 [Dentipellis sp. KUC8613]|nr:hypothetical protein DENSPDRAFT_927031 [Dentipellis sp. KUC8613]
MSSTLSPQQSNTSRPWWSRSSSSKSLNNEKSSSSAAKQGSSKKFNTLATAIGLKPKKTALAIQDPPSPVLPLHTPDIDEPPPLTFTTRPPAKSVSTVRSWDDLPEPRTPSEPWTPEPPKDRSSFSRSVMTVSDVDPFASRYVGPGHDHARLSVFSDASTSDSHGRKGDHSSEYNRTSYASSSSHSHRRADMTSDAAAMASSSLMSPDFDRRRLSRLTVESEKIVRREPPFLPPQSAPASPRLNVDGPSDPRHRVRSSASSTTLTDKKPLKASDMPALPHLKTRPRGMTESTPASRRGPLSSSDTRPTPSQYPTNISPLDSRPRVVVRQPSLNRVQPLYPPSAPPTAGLPAPPQRNPHSSSRVYLGEQLREPSPASTNSSSSLSFASSASSHYETARTRTQSQGARGKLETPQSANDRARALSREASRGRSSTGAPNMPASPPSRAEFSPTRTLKKAVSQQSLPKRSSGTGPPTGSGENKPLKKQRSFHHSRIPIPPMPASLWHSHSSPPPVPTGHEETSPILEHRRGSGNSVFGMQNPGVGRKRLFSGSSMRRSTSSQAHSAADDDGHSIFSSPGDEYRFSGSAASAGNRSDATSSSFWDEAEAPTSPSGVDYIPQQIMSPADMLRVEALLQEESQAKAGRPRGESFTSVSTSMSNALSIGTSASHGPSDWASHEDFSPISEIPSNRLSGSPQAARVSTGTRHAHRPTSMLSKNTSPPVHTNVRPSTAQTSPSRSSFFGSSSTNSFGLPPPPRARPSTATGADTSFGGLNHRTSVVQISPLSPPPAWKNNVRRAATTSDKVVPQRRSIMKKPSFLEIEDEREKAKSPDPGDNFLDMDFGKASFDTVRSEEQEEFGPR